jgi:hypothetical protein
MTGPIDVLTEKVITQKDRLSVNIRNHMIVTETPEKYLYLQWVRITKDTILVKDMTRSHVQNSLNWCIKKKADPDEQKDGVLYSDWIAFFLARLLDPTLE